MHSLRDYIIHNLPANCESEDCNTKTEVILTDLNEVVLRLCDRKKIIETVSFLRNDDKLRFDVLIDICGVDNLSTHPRFDVVYHFLSIKYNSRIRLKVGLNDGESLDSLTGIFKASNWYEREVYDMYGIKFDSHPDLNRILTDYEFEGYPLRKDFPLSGHTQVCYDAEIGQVINEPVQLMQELRNFNFITPWKGETSTITGVAQGLQCYVGDNE